MKLPKRRLWIAALAVGLALSALGVSTAGARSDAPNRVARAALPLRVMMYETTPAKVKAGRPGPAVVGHTATTVRSHLAALAWARADAAIVRWNGHGTAGDRTFAAVLASIVATHAHVRAAALIDRARGNARAQVRALARQRMKSRGYLRIRSRPAVFVALADSLRSCAQARRWRAAARGMWLGQAAFPGYASCRSAADAWFRDAPATRTARASGSFLIRPGYWKNSARAPEVSRSIVAWRRSIQRMVASRQPLQMIDSLNDWAHGSAIEASAAWASASGFGLYLDALHAAPPAVPPPGDTPPQTTPGTSNAPTVDTPVASNVTTHQATISSTVSAGASPATTWVEYGPTTAYGQATNPVSLAAGSSQKVPVVLSSLSAAVHYFARVVVFSPAGRVNSPDVAFSTLTETKVVRVATAGDIACDPNEANFNGGQGTATACRQFAVSSAILAGGYDAVLPLGDQQYNAGSAAAFAASYHPSWGRLDSIAHPVVGNHEYGRPAAGPYFQYFGAAAGTPGQGWYSYELGAWHVVALNANCARIAGGCGVGSPQELWLRADLAAHPTGCTLAYWHQPLFTSGQEPSTPEVAAFWNDLAAAGAEVVLNGHEHVYERFAPQTPTGQRDDARGIREFVVGTGGENHMSYHATPAANTEVRDKTSFGFLELGLGNGAYSWTFRPTAPDSFTDSGTGTCH
jgi:Calcineurin-like phosphoesterase